MKHKTIEPMTTLDCFGYYELEELNKLIHAYMNNDNTKDGKHYAKLPATWYDEGVYPDFNRHSGKVFLANSDYQALVLTEYGVMQWYNTGYNDHEGTLFDLAAEIIYDLTTKDGDPLPYKDTVWHKDDLNEVYGWLNECINDFDGTGADTADLYKAKELIVKAFILDRLPDVADKFKAAHEDWYAQLTSSESNLVDGFLGAMLTDLEHEFNDDEAEKYAEFIRNEMINHLS